jgi:hypothetical protein
MFPPEIKRIMRVVSQFSLNDPLLFDVRNGKEIHPFQDIP